MVSQHHPEIQLHSRKPSSCIYSEEQRRYLDSSSKDYLALESVRGNMTAGSFGMNGCVCTSMVSTDVCLDEDHWTSSLRKFR